MIPKKSLGPKLKERKKGMKRALNGKALFISTLLIVPTGLFRLLYIEHVQQERCIQASSDS